VYAEGDHPLFAAHLSSLTRQALHDGSSETEAAMADGLVLEAMGTMPCGRVGIAACTASGRPKERAMTSSANGRSFGTLSARSNPFEEG
jgi:hypothetical protein